MSFIREYSRKIRAHLALNNYPQIALDYIRDKKVAPILVFVFLLYLLVVYKLFTFPIFSGGGFLIYYSFLVTGYIVSRFVLAYFYSAENIADPNYLPTITFVTPAKNEKDNIGHTLRAMLRSDYPREKGLSDWNYRRMAQSDVSRHEMHLWRRPGAHEFLIEERIRRDIQRRSIRADRRPG
jgi:hypothetical protein